MSQKYHITENFISEVHERKEGFLQQMAAIIRCELNSKDDGITGNSIRQNRDVTELLCRRKVESVN